MEPPNPISAPPGSMRYQMTADVQWTVETEGLIVTDGRGGTTRFSYPEAAIWDLLSRSYDFPTIAWMMHFIAGLEEEASRRLVRDTLQRWHSARLLTRDEGA